jgi:hypothetical protein
MVVPSPHATLAGPRTKEVSDTSASFREVEKATLETPRLLPPAKQPVEEGTSPVLASRDNGGG